MGKGVWILIVLVIVGGIWYFGYRGGDESEGGLISSVPAPGGEGVDETIVGGGSDEGDGGSGDDDGGSVGERRHSVDVTNDGFVPRNLEINAGDTVIWTNRISRQTWPATAVHPTHTVYPGSTRSRCGSGTAEDMFDACKGLNIGETYSFIFEERGSWSYHDHLRNSVRGTVIVN